MLTHQQLVMWRRTPCRMSKIATTIKGGSSGGGRGRHTVGFMRALSIARDIYARPNELEPVIIKCYASLGSSA